MAGNVTLPQGIEIFKEGTHVDDAGVPRTFSRADVDAMAAAYDPALHDAPLTVGHPQTDEPRFGGVHTLQAVDGQDGKRTLTMAARDVAPAFAEAVLNKRFPKRSTAFYSPEHPQNPKPGSWYVRHVGFLGAQPPAVRGLADLPGLQRIAQFADAGLGLVAFSEPISTTTEEDRMSKELQDQLDAEKAARTKAEADRDAATAKLQEAVTAQRTQRHAEHVAFAEAQMAAGKLKKPEVVELTALLDLAADATPVQFGEAGAQKTLAAVPLIKRLVERAGALANFSEQPNPGAGSGGGGAAGRSDADIDSEAKAYAAKHNVSYSEALGKVVSFTA